MEGMITAAVERLNKRLPLAARQTTLPEELAGVHRAILRSLAEHGRPLSREEITARVDGDVDGLLGQLAAADLVVLNADASGVIGAYPMTMEETPHRLRVNGQPVNAMCALDALSVGPMFDADVEISSHCHVTRTPVFIHMQGDAIIDVHPSPAVRVGVHWQDSKTCAAHSLCLEMVYLLDEVTALEWQNGDSENISLFTLPEAVEFGAAFFNPLVRG